MSRLGQIRAELERQRQLVGLVLRVGFKTGLISHISAGATRFLIESVVRGQHSPSTLYRFQALTQPNKVAIIWRDRKVTFAALDQEIDCVAHSLRERGFGPDDGGGSGAPSGTAVLMLKNRPEFIVLQPAMSRLGAAGVNISWRSTPSELAYLLDHCGAQALFFEAELADVVREALDQTKGLPRERVFSVGGDVDGFPAYLDLVRLPVNQKSSQSSADPALIIYTSGTTGKPKGAVRRYPRDALPGTLQIILSAPLHTDDIHLAVLPFYHSTAYAFTNFSHLVGATVLILDDPTPRRFLECIASSGVTQSAMVPTLLHRILALGKHEIWRHDLRSLRGVITAGAPLGGALAAEFMDVFGDILHNFYGATETGLNTHANPLDLRESPGTIGRPVPGNEILLLDEQGNSVPEGEKGELFVRGPMLVEGYHRDEAATQAALKRGAFSVGDLAWRDTRGCYHLAGRKSDMIISGGVNVYPAEIERVLEAHPDVRDSAVVGIPDEEWGERVIAFVEPQAHATDSLVSALSEHCKGHLMGPKRPRDYVVVDALPRNPTGKVVKRELRREGRNHRP